MVKSEYIVKRVVDNEYDPVLLELESIGSGNTLFVELNNTTIPDWLQLHMIMVYIDSSDVSKESLDSSDKLLRAAIRHYIDIDDVFEIHATIKFDDNDYTITSIIAQ